MSDISYRWYLDNDTQGKDEIQEPIGGNELEIQLQRNIEDGFYGLIQLFQEASLGFYAAAKDYIDDVIAADGIDAEIRIDIDISTDGAITYTDYFDGVLDMEGMEKIDDEVNGLVYYAKIHESKFYQTLKKHMDTKVRLDTANDIFGFLRETINTYSINLHAQTIRLDIQGDATSDQSTGTSTGSWTTDTFYLGCTFDGATEELEEFENPPIYWEQSTLTNLPAFYTLKDSNIVEDERKFYVKGDTQVIITNQIGSLETITSVTIRYYVERNRGGSKSTKPIGPETTAAPGTVSATINHTMGSTEYYESFTSNQTDDVFSIYLQVDITKSAGIFQKDVDADFDYNNPNFFNVRLSATSDYPATTANGIEIHEAGQKIVNKVTGVDGSFYSLYLGNKDTTGQTYTANGCGSFCALIQGAQIRGKSLGDVPFAMSFRQWWRGAAPIWNLGLDIESTPRVRIEQKSFFFGTGSPTITLLGVNKLSRVIAEDIVYNSVEVGYKWKSSEFNSEDEFNSKREYSAPLARVGNKYTINSEFVAGTYAIEKMRRATSETKSSDFDDDIFIIALNRSVDGDSIPTSMDTPEKDENLSMITGLLYPEDAYNMRLTPGRNFLRWGNIVSTGLVEYSTAVWFQQNSDGNNSLTTVQDGDSCEGDYNGGYFAESQDIDWDYASLDETTPLFKPYRWTFEYPLTKDQFDDITADLRQSIEVEDWDGTLREMFIWSLTYKAHEPLAIFECIEANV